MKEFKGFIFYFTIVFIIVCSLLVINIHNNSEKAMNMTLSFEVDEEFKQFISNSRYTLYEYKMSDKKHQKTACYNEIEKAINYIDETQNQGEKTYKEIFKKYYDVNNERAFSFLNFTNINNECGLSNDKLSSEQMEVRKVVTRGAIMYDVVFEAHVNDYLYANIQPVFGFKRIFKDNVKISGWSIFKKAKFDIPSQMEMFAKDYINGILELVGDQYEK